MVKKDTNLLWQYKIGAHFGGKFPFQSDNAAVKRWSMKMYSSGCDWGVFNAWSVLEECRHDNDV